MNNSMQIKDGQSIIAIQFESNVHVMIKFEVLQSFYFQQTKRENINTYLDCHQKPPRNVVIR